MARRKIVSFDNVSADGCFADAQGGLDWVVPSGDVTAAAMRAAPGVDTMLFGRKTYAMFEQGWRDKDAAPHTGVATPESRQMSAWINEKAKIVFSKTLREVTWRNSRLFSEIDGAALEALKNEPGGDMIVFGSGSIVARLTELALVDEYTFVVNPVFLGKGRSLLAALEGRVKLALVAQEAFPSSGHVVLRYRRG